MSAEEQGGAARGEHNPPAAEEMLAEARESAVSGGGDADGGAERFAAGDPEPGVIADTGQPAGTADARAAGVMDTEGDGEERREP